MTNAQPAQAADRRVLQIAPEDNVGVATQTIEAGEPLHIAGQPVAIATRIPTGHKLALRPIAAREKVVKYGLPIGSATADIRPGEYVHTHNLRSDYLPTYTLDGSNPYLRENEVPSPSGRCENTRSPLPPGEG